MSERKRRLGNGPMRSLSAGAARRKARRRGIPESELRRREALSAQTPYLGLVRAPHHPPAPTPLGPELSVATYNVHRWTGLNGRAAPDPARAGFVISELDQQGADLIALQEALRPFDAEECPLEGLGNGLRRYVAFVVTRVHRKGELGNAVFSRWPIQSVFTLDLTFSRLERRAAVAIRFADQAGSLCVVATHLALGDRTRNAQVEHILQHPHLAGPVVLVGDMNAWRPSKAIKTLDRELGHHNLDWPATFPAARPVLALDRVYARHARMRGVKAHDTAAARRASDHLPVIASLSLHQGADDS